MVSASAPGRHLIARFGPALRPTSGLCHGLGVEVIGVIGQARAQLTDSKDALAAVQRGGLDRVGLRIGGRDGCPAGSGQVKSGPSASMKLAGAGSCRVEGLPRPIGGGGGFGAGVAGHGGNGDDVCPGRPDRRPEVSRVAPFSICAWLSWASVISGGHGCCPSREASVRNLGLDLVQGARAAGGTVSIPSRRRATTPAVVQPLQSLGEVTLGQVMAAATLRQRPHTARIASLSSAFGAQSRSWPILIHGEIGAQGRQVLAPDRPGRIVDGGALTVRDHGGVRRPWPATSNGQASRGRLVQRGFLGGQDAVHRGRGPGPDPRAGGPQRRVRPGQRPPSPAAHQFGFRVQHRQGRHRRTAPVCDPGHQGFKGRFAGESRLCLGVSSLGFLFGRDRPAVRQGAFLGTMNSARRDW